MVKPGRGYRASRFLFHSKLICMMDFFRFTFSSLGVFIGMMLLLSGISSFILIMWNRYWRHKNIRLHGYPPPHCDADGDFKEEKEKNKDAHEEDGYNSDW